VKKIFLPALLFAGLMAMAQQKNTLLEQGFWKGSPDVAAVKAEIEKGSNSSASNPMNMDAPTLAILGGASVDVVKFLVEQPGNSISKITHEGRTYLHWASMKGNSEIVAYLLSKGSDLTIEEEHGLTPAYLAAGNGGNVAMFEVFVKNGLDLKKKYKDGASLLMLALPTDKDFSVTNYFISKGLSVKDVDANGNSTINYAARGGNIDGIKKLQKLGVKYNEQALIFAAQGTRRSANTIEIYKYLVDDLKIKPTVTTKENENVLHLIGKKQNQAEIVKYFLAKGVDINQINNDGNTPFIIASSGKDLATVKAMFPKVKNINAVNQKGESALTQAVKSSSAEVVGFLIAKGADINIKDKKGNSLTYYLVDGYRVPRGGFSGASQQDDFTEKLTLLKEKGLNTTAPQKDGSTLYHLAIAKNDLAILKKLNGLTLDVNAVNNEGLTVLHKAALTAKNDEILKYLISVGAKKEVKTELNETAYDLAKENTYLSKNNISVDFLR
jgi:ankyrin repeat protein